MKKIIAIIVSICIFAVLPASCAHQKSDEELIKERVESFLTAYNNGDLEAVLSCMDTKSKNEFSALMNIGDALIGGLSGFDISVSNIFSLAIGVQMGDVLTLSDISVDIQNEKKATVNAVMGYDDTMTAYSGQVQFVMVKENDDWFINDLKPVRNSVTEDISSGSETEGQVTEELQNIDPFEGLQVQFDGISPYVTVSFNTLDCEDIVSENVTFELDKEMFKEGETFTVTASFDKKELEEKGYSISNVSKEYTVENVPKYITSADNADFTELNKNMYDYVEANANGSVGESSIFDVYANEINHILYAVNKIDDIEYVGSCFMSLKNSNDIAINDNTYNKYYRIYSIDFTAVDERKIYVAVGINNISINTDGKICYNIGQEFSPSMLYYKAEITEEELNSKHIVSEKGSYNVTEID